MKARNQGVVVNIIGAAGERFNYDYITGSAGNAALMAFTKALGGKSLHYGVRIVGINPGTCRNRPSHLPDENPCQARVGVTIDGAR